MAEPQASRRRRRWRPWLRAVHRDVGYFIIGLTVIYAVSGLAVNHIDDWNANYIEYEKTHPLPGSPSAPEVKLVRNALNHLGIDEQPRDVFAEQSEVEVQLSDRVLLIDRSSKTLTERVRKPRPLVRVANWLHLNRGKRAWTYIADGYAIMLLLVALSGAFMIPGRKGLLGRGGLLIALGGAVPVLYVALSGGP